MNTLEQIKSAAELANVCGRMRIIRVNGEDYMERYWLSLGEDDNISRLESGRSMLLHHILRYDPQPMHDHPWDFSSTVLHGGYLEELPGGTLITRLPGSTIQRAATDLHRIAAVDPDTWTLVFTGPRVREWGFQGDGGVWTPWRKFLGVTGEDA